jgi:GT2 family glycosyltransferase
MPRVSVVVPTFRRSHHAQRLFAALRAQTLPVDEFEVVVCDDGSGAEAVDRWRVAATDSGLRAGVLVMPDNGGPARARNAGWRSSKAPVVAFTDDDCIPAPDWLEQGLRAMQADDVVVVGQVAPVADQLAERGYFSRVLSVQDASLFHTANAFYRRSDLELVDGFDESFTLAVGEDTDLGLRVVALGRQPVYAPDALVHHEVGPDSLWLHVKQCVVRWSKLVQLFKKHPHLREQLCLTPHVWKPAHPTVALAAVGLMLAPRTPGALALTAPWLRQRLRTMPAAKDRRERITTLPSIFVGDLAEVAGALYGSARYRSFLL